MNVQIFHEIDLQNSLINLVHLIASHGHIIIRIMNSEKILILKSLAFLILEGAFGYPTLPFPL